MAQKFDKTLTLAEMTAKVLNTDANVYNRVYEYVVGAQQQATWGSGSIVNGVDNRGKLTLSFKDANGNEIKGWVRLAITDANEIQKYVVFEERTERLTDYRLSEYNTLAKEDSKLVIEFQPDTSATIDTSNSTGLLPITIYY